MPPHLDHTILNVNDRAKSVEFYTSVLGFTHEGEREGTPFSVIRVTPDFMLQLAPFGTKGNEHLAFCMSRAEFDQAFQRIRERGIEYGDSFDTVGGLHPNFPPVISRVRGLFRPPGAVLFAPV